MNVFKKISELETQLNNLASRPYTKRAEGAKVEAVTAQNKVNKLDTEMADMFLAMAEMITGGDENE